MYISLMVASVVMVEKTTGVQQVIDRLNHLDMKYNSLPMTLVA